MSKEKLIDISVLPNCKNRTESYGQICVKCNKCGGFDTPINTPINTPTQNQFNKQFTNSELEQIEEMAVTICKSRQACLAKDGESCRSCNQSEWCMYQNIARAIYREGYRKQSENVIELPCKVGTTLYFLYNSPYADKPDLTPRIYKTADWYFEVDKTGIVINTSDIHGFNKKYDYHLGKTVFLTKEDAEQTLAKMKGGAE